MNALIDLGKCREYMTVTIGGKDHQIKLSGTIEDPYFCGKDVCAVLGYSNIQKALYENVKSKCKKTLHDLSVQPWGRCTYLGSLDHKNLSYNEGKAVYISEPGLYSLLNGSTKFKNKQEFKTQIEKWILDIKYGQNSGLMDIFSFVKGYNLAFDINSNWFQDLWYPLSKSRPPQLGGPEKVENQPIIVTQNLLEWMGFKGRNLSDKQERFSRVLRSHEIPYDEIGYQHPLALEYPCVQKEAEQLKLSFNLDKKKWICMDQRAFKKAVMRINTENAEIVRDYYLNLEEAMFAYGEYTMNYLIDKTERTRKLRDSELSIAMEQLAIKEKSEQQALLAIEAARAAEEELRREQEDLKNKLVKAERKAIRVNKFMKRITVKEKKMEWIYIATNNFYALERLWKVGSTIRLSSRIGGYNTGRAKGVDNYYYVWAIKCYNSRDVDNHIQKLLTDFKWKDPRQSQEEQSKDNRSEMYHGIKFTDLKDIVAFIVNNYDASIDYINNFIKNRLDQSMEEEDEIPPPLDYKRLTYQIGEHVETIDLEEEESDSIREAFEDILSSIREQHDRNSEPVVVQRKDIINRLSNVTNTAKKDIWSQIKELTGWTNSKSEIDDGSFKYKITY